MPHEVIPLSNMLLTDTIDTVRKNYMEVYQAARDEYKELYMSSSNPELMLQFQENGFSGLLFNRGRKDLACESATPPDYTEVNVEPLKFERRVFPTQFGIEVTVEPFVWNDVEFVCGEFDWQSDGFMGWCREWLDVDKRKKPEKNGFFGVIHTVTQPIVANGICRFNIDFGSAPVEAFEELLLVLNELGVNTLRICSDFYLGGYGGKTI